MAFRLSTGILQHPTSLPWRGGVGDFGPAAYAFVDFLSAARQGLWQVLPLGPPANGDSPYSSTSAFAGNPLLVSLERLAERGWLDASQLNALPNSTGHIDYAQVQMDKFPLLADAANKFLQSATPFAQSRFERFCEA